MTINIAQPKQQKEGRLEKDKKKFVRHQWLTPVILTTQEAEIRRITVQNQPRQIVP
jgi:hypothetical protein